MRFFNLLIDGIDLDTGIYEYFPYTDLKISDFKATFRTLTGLKTGKLTEDSDEVKKYVYGKYCIGTDETNKQAVAAAHKAFLQFRRFPLSARKKIALDIHDLLCKKKEEFIRLLVLEGHPTKLAEWEFEGMHVGSNPESINFYCKQIQKEIGKQANEILYWARRPDGVVCMSPPRNASASDSFNAILVFLTGNTLVVKPPLKEPLSTIFLWKDIVNEALKKNNAPPGTLNIILGNSKVIMDEWLSDDSVNDVIFFGDSKKGLEIGTKVFKAGKKPILELSGNDMMLVWKDGDIKRARNSLIEGFLGSTQICMIPKVAVVHHEVYDKFISSYLKLVDKLKISLPSDPDTMLSPVVKIPEYFEFLKDALEKGAKLLCGGKRVNHCDQEDNNGIYIKPTVLKIENLESAVEMKCLNEEIFFPLIPVIKVNGSDDDVFQKMTSLANRHRFGLRLSLWISSAKYLRKLAKQLDSCGMLRINSRHAGFSSYLSTHGGPRQSGGPFGEMNYFWEKTSHLQGVSRTILKKTN